MNQLDPGVYSNVFSSEFIVTLPIAPKKSTVGPDFGKGDLWISRVSA